MNVNLDQLEKGIYFILIKQSNGTIIKKIIKN